MFVAGIEARSSERRRRRHFLRQRPRVEHAAAGHHHVLTAVELVHDRTVADTADHRVPERRAIAGAKREDAVGRVTGKRETCVGRQHAGAALATDVVLPLHLAGLVVDRAQHALPGHAVVGARPSVRSVLGLEEIDPVGILRADDEEAGARIETRRTVIRPTALVGRNQPAITRGLHRPDRESGFPFRRCPWPS